jgi:hypothetical protein
MPCSYACHLFSRFFHAWLILRPWRWRRHVPPKCWLTLMNCMALYPRKIILFLTTTVRTSNPNTSEGLKGVFLYFPRTSVCVSKLFTEVEQWFPAHAVMWVSSIYVMLLLTRFGLSRSSNMQGSHLMGGVSKCFT